MIDCILKTIDLRKHFQLQSCSEFDFEQLCQYIASLAVARGVPLQVITIATKIAGAIDQIIASL